jgi:hypothetical protein
MPFIGCMVGSAFMTYIQAVDHWIAFALLAFIGGNMIVESLKKDEGCECGCSCENTDSSIAPKVMFTMAVATSIDALAAGVGMSVSLEGIGQILFAVISIGVITFTLSAAGVKIGNVALLGIPGEPFTDIGVGIKEAEGWDLILPCALTNGNEGYFPMQSAYDEGGYEARTSPYRAGVAETFIREGKALLDELRK